MIYKFLIGQWYEKGQGKLKNEQFVGKKSFKPKPKYHILVKLLSDLG
jgi:hypothetical protein